MVSIYMMAPDGNEYPQDLYLPTQIMQLKLECGGETLTIVSAYKESFLINNYEVAEVIEWTRKYSYFGTPDTIYFETANATSEIDQRYVSDITDCPPNEFTLYLDN